MMPVKSTFTVSGSDESVLDRVGGTAVASMRGSSLTSGASSTSPADENIVREIDATSSRDTLIFIGRA